MKAFKSIMGNKSKKNGNICEDSSENGTCISGSSASSRSAATGGPSKDEIDFFLNADKNQLLARLEELAVEDEAQEKSRKKQPKSKKSNKPLEKRRNESNASALQRALAEGHI